MSEQPKKNDSKPELSVSEESSKPTASRPTAYLLKLKSGMYGGFVYINAANFCGVVPAPAKGSCFIMLNGHNANRILVKHEPDQVVELLAHHFQVAMVGVRSE